MSLILEMININVIVDGVKYFPSDLKNPRLQPLHNIQLIKKGLTHIFKPIQKEFPDHDISVSWNEDEKSLSHSSDSLDPSIIDDALIKYHGTTF
jgi:hypothetical protein